MTQAELAFKIDSPHVAKVFDVGQVDDALFIAMELLEGQTLDRTIGGRPLPIATTLALEPELMLLDEPSSGLNVEETDDMAYWIQDIRDELGITVLMVEHDMSLVSRVSDRVLAVNFGKVLAQGTPSEVQAHPDVIAAYLGQA